MNKYEVNNAEESNVHKLANFQGEAVCDILSHNTHSEYFADNFTIIFESGGISVSAEAYQDETVAVKVEVFDKNKAENLLHRHREDTLLKVLDEALAMKDKEHGQGVAYKALVNFLHGIGYNDIAKKFGESEWYG